MAVNKDILLQKWEPSNDDLISKASDIACNDDIIAEFCAGMKVANNKHSIIGYNRILSNKIFFRRKNTQDSGNGFSRIKYE